MKRRWWSVVLWWLGLCTHEQERLRTDGWVECVNCTRTRQTTKGWRESPVGRNLPEELAVRQQMERENRRPQEVTGQELAELRRKKKVMERRWKKISS